MKNAEDDNLAFFDAVEDGVVAGRYLAHAIAEFSALPSRSRIIREAVETTLEPIEKAIRGALAVVCDLTPDFDQIV